MSDLVGKTRRPVFSRRGSLMIRVLISNGNMASLDVEYYVEDSVNRFGTLGSCSFFAYIEDIKMSEGYIES